MCVSCVRKMFPVCVIPPSKCVSSIFLLKQQVCELNHDKDNTKIEFFFNNLFICFYLEIQYNTQQFGHTKQLIQCSDPDQPCPDSTLENVFLFFLNLLETASTKGSRDMRKIFCNAYQYETEEARCVYLCEYVGRVPQCNSTRIQQTSLSLWFGLHYQYSTDSLQIIKRDDTDL